MSDDFNVNFGGAKAPELPEDGNQVLVISDYKISDPKKAESLGTGKTIAIQFKFQDQELYRGTVYHYLWLDYENPWAAKLFFEAVTGQEIDDDFDAWKKPEMWIGEKVGAFLAQDSYEKNGQTKKKLIVAGAEAFYEVD